MIASLSGKLLQKKQFSVVLDVHGVGYEVCLTDEDQKKLPLAGHNIFLWTHLHIKETQWVLFGFFNMQKRDFFRQLLGVSGLGPKLALSCANALEPNELVQIVLSQSSEKLQQIPGIGKKMAARLVLELGSIIKKIGGVSVPTSETHREDSSAVSSASLNANPLVDEAIQAMRQLGYKDELSLRRIAQEILKKDPLVEVGDLIKGMLRRCDVQAH